MDDCTRQPILPSLELASPAPAQAPAPTTAAPQEATGDSESDTHHTPVSGLTVGDRPSVAAADYAEDDAESCSGAGGSNNRAPVDDGDGDVRGAEDDAAVEGDESEEVDSRMCVPWWRRTVQEAAGGGCARPQAATAEGGAAVVAGASHAAESNRLFWEACIAHGY